MMTTVGVAASVRTSGVQPYALPLPPSTLFGVSEAAARRHMTGGGVVDGWMRRYYAGWAPVYGYRGAAERILLVA